MEEIKEQATNVAEPSEAPEKPHRGRPKKKPELRGGARAGAGRPKEGREAKNESIALAVTKDTKRRYVEIKKRGVNVNQTIAETIDQLATLLGIS